MCVRSGFEAILCNYSDSCAREFVSPSYPCKDLSTRVQHECCSPTKGDVIGFAACGTVLGCSVPCSSNQCCDSLEHVPSPPPLFWHYCWPYHFIFTASRVLGSHQQLLLAYNGPSFIWYAATSQGLFDLAVYWGTTYAMACLL